MELHKPKGLTIISDVDKEKLLKDGYFAQIPFGVIRAVARQLDGNCGNQLKIMIFLLGSRPGFVLTQSYIEETMGLSKNSYLVARKALEDRGWITISRKDKTIQINYKEILEIIDAADEAPFDRV